MNVRVVRVVSILVEVCWSLLGTLSKIKTQTNGFQITEKYLKKAFLDQCG